MANYLYILVTTACLLDITLSAPADHHHGRDMTGPFRFHGCCNYKGSFLGPGPPHDGYDCPKAGDETEGSGSSKAVVAKDGHNKAVVAKGGPNNPVVGIGGPNKPVVANGGPNKPVVGKGGSNNAVVAKGGSSKTVIDNGGPAVSIEDNSDFGVSVATKVGKSEFSVSKGARGAGATNKTTKDVKNSSGNVNVNVQKDHGR